MRAAVGEILAGIRNLGLRKLQSIRVSRPDSAISAARNRALASRAFGQDV